MSRHQVDVIHGTAIFSDGNTISVAQNDGAVQTLTAEKILIATGTRPHHPATYPWHDARLFESDTILSIPELPASMLIIGGVAVRLAALPEWAQHVSAFFPGRYAVEAIQGCVTGPGLPGLRFSVLALVLTGAAGCVAGARLFRWDAQQRFARLPGKIWLLPAFAAWLAVGLLAEIRGRIAVPADAEPPPAAAPKIAPLNPAVAPAPAAASSAGFRAMISLSSSAKQVSFSRRRSARSSMARLRAVRVSRLLM